MLGHKALIPFLIKNYENVCSYTDVIVCMFLNVCTYMHMQESPTKDEANDWMFVWI